MMNPSEAWLFSGLVCEGDMVSGPQSTAAVKGRHPAWTHEQLLAELSARSELGSGCLSLGTECPFWDILSLEDF